MYYILTTYFPNHWDKIPNNRTSYKRRFLSITDDRLKNNTPTIFLWINKDSKNIEKAWIGKIFNIEKTDDSIFYSIKIEKEIEVDPEFASTKIGWYVIDEELDLSKDEVSQKTTNPHILNGNWDQGIALNLHTLKSIKLPDGKFDTTYTTLGNALHKLKYWKDISFIPFIVDNVCVFLNNDFSNFLKITDVILPVPPSDTSRSFQPVYELAKSVSSKVNIPADFNYLIKLKSTSQIKSIEDPDERKRILDGAIDMKDKRYEGKNVLLFDDLFRSGSTLAEITKLLKDKGKVKLVFVLTITKTRTKR
ncbi:MAG: hypothetical protein SGI89_02220 [bacterium]|nr:hypothetical protein [bacterium]